MRKIMIILFISLVFFISAYTFAKIDSEPFFDPQASRLNDSIEDQVRESKAERF